MLLCGKAALSLSPCLFFCHTHRYTLLYHAHASNKRQTTQSSHSRARLHPKIDLMAIRGKLSGVSKVTSKLLIGNELTLEIQLYEWSKEDSFYIKLVLQTHRSIHQATHLNCGKHHACTSEKNLELQRLIVSMCTICDFEHVKSRL